MKISFANGFQRQMKNPDTKAFAKTRYKFRSLKYSYIQGENFFHKNTLKTR